MNSPKLTAPRSYYPELISAALALAAVFIALSSIGAQKPKQDLPVVIEAAIEKSPERVIAQINSRPGDPLPRTGDEIVACGQFFHTTTPVVLWMDPGGYDAYRTESRFVPFENAEWKKASEVQKQLGSPNRFGLRKDLLSSEEIERLRGGGWDLPTLQSRVDQFVLHYDAAGLSRTCFKVLHDMRCLSVHFMLDVDGTIYQTLDLKERAWHASTSNSRSIGIEIANIGAFSEKELPKLNSWYKKHDDSSVTLIFPSYIKETGIRTPGFIGSPARPDLIEGEIQGKKVHQYDLTPQQYQALIKLTATLCKIFPKITCDYPRDESGKLILQKLPDDELKKFNGVLGHYHIQTDKIDPGPALQWDYLLDSAKALNKQNVDMPK